MNCTFLPSLEHVVLVKIATTLWNQSDIRALIVELKLDSLYEDSIILENIEEKVKEKVLLLNTPNSLKEKILCVIKPIGLEIYRWMKCNKEYYNLIAVNLRDEFSWTPHGTIDSKKTAEALMTDETIDITRRYKLACIYCLENYVGALWERMPENHRASFYSEEDPKEVAQHELVVIWTYYIKEEMAKLENIIRCSTLRYAEMIETCTLEQYPFFCAFYHCNKVAVEYFWSKLSIEDREYSIRFIVSNWVNGHYAIAVKDCLDIFCFLFPRVNKDQQTAFLEKHGWGVLVQLLQWPWQSLFMDMAKHVVLTNTHYDIFLNDIVSKVAEGYKDYDYQRLFGEIWQKSPENYKKSVIGRFCDGHDLLLKLFRNKMVKNISLILKDASVLEKAAICDSIGSCSSFAFSYWIKERIFEFDMLEFFTNEFISSHEMMTKFKGKCMMMSWYDDRVEKIFDDLIEKFNLKRNTEESHCSSA